MSNRRVPMEEVLAARRLRQVSGKWPSRTPDNRLEPQATPIVTPKFSLADARSFFTIGSCFARNIEEFLDQRGYEVPTAQFFVPKEEWPTRPSGILNKYTPPSIYQELDRTFRGLKEEGAKQDEILQETILHVKDGTAVDMELAGFAKVTPERALERRRQVLNTFAHAFSADVVTLTLGLVESWWDNHHGRYVQQVPPLAVAKDHPGRFQFELLTFDAARDYVRRSVELILAHGKPGVKILITTSPVPLGASFAGEDILVSNTYAKSVLRAVSTEIAAEFPDVAYFPSYECVMLSRDPGIWEDDLIHIKHSYVGKIVDLLLSSYLSPQASAAA